MPTREKSEECMELKNIKYKTMLLNGNKKNLNSVINEASNLELLLEEESESNKKESWNKLDKSEKMNKISLYINRLINEHKLSNIESESLKDYLSQNIDKKNLLKNKDVIYSKETGILECIPNLQFNNSTRKFTLKKQHQQSVLKSVGPTRKNRSKWNKKISVVKITSSNKLNSPRSPKKNKFLKK